jgi:hypothetical protein
VKRRGSIWRRLKGASVKGKWEPLVKREAATGEEKREHLEKAKRSFC